MKYLIAFIIPVVLMYLTGSFVDWDFNPGHWPSPDRAGFAALAGCLALPCMMIANEYKRKG